LTLLCALGCTLGRSEYQRASERASASYGRGAYQIAEKEWREAERIAESDRDRSEARYRAAVSAERAGESKRAAQALVELAERWPKSERAPRALFDAARIELEQGSSARAAELFEKVMRTYPESASATPAARQWLELVAPQGDARMARLDALLGERAWPPVLDEALRYDRARRLEASGQLEEAARGYAEVARRHPYPFGAYWDDALFRQAELERRQGRAREAIAAIRTLLAEREDSRLSGTTERERFAPAQYLEAEILRDDMRDPAGARRAFRAVFDRFPTSRLRDDALWQEARLAAQSGAPNAACEPLELLLRDLADSRYARCAGLLCPALEGKSAALGTCASYVRRELEEPPATLK
jgi:TolA-binding protein